MNNVVATPNGLGYLTCHDNLTLVDLLNFKNVSQDKIHVVMKYLISCDGPLLWRLGDELLFSKNGDNNSYTSSIWINSIDWNCLNSCEVTETRRQFRKLVQERNKLNTDITIKYQ
mgnify:CR=1 FL=1